MRLTCPNCGAQYEVPDDVIPQDGRDVQCSNCGTTWFQPHADAAPIEGVGPDPDELRSTLDDLGEAPAEMPKPEETALPDQLPVDKAETPEPRAPRSLDPEVTSVLQEEAEHETRLRAEEATGLETQPDLGLDDTTDDAERRARQARDRMDRLRGSEQDTSVEEAVAAAAAAAKASRRDRLPDIDEINSSLRASTTRSHADGRAQDHLGEAPRKSGFARGFAIPLIVVTLLVLLYANAPRLAETVPALGSVLTSYVLLVDQARQWLDTQIGAFLP
ncbi:zinc-ribbon domain-containing protein [Aestuariivita sp.]|jgi:predicted Zn finger-like uncharacterized protein|uniref:zinc-ribbon domain-containing protein n=1 Tax=Aestuariivita sp. TaxID=1872407 RepID=UPI002172A5B6|nr:zinc-ribbon domain-containing protein [Aestuariivita sp.]MCE8006878.1 hypothetical protein [Aestuariivita sp.]